MNDNAYGEGFRGHTLAATFDSRQQADQAVQRLSERVQGARVEVKSKRQDRKVQQAEMRDELEGMVASPVLGAAMTKSQTQGAIGGTILIAGLAILIGVVAGFLIDGAPGSDVSPWRWFMTWVMIPAIAGGTLGTLAGGMLKQRYKPAPEDSAPPREAAPDAGLEAPEETVVEVHASGDADLQQAMDVLQGLNPQRLDRFNSAGEVVETQQLGGRTS
ncbi:MAG TPA: hypothetical protein VHJ78_01970 [Actinomycetota bacterium]|nr:hypothetical protein [Actinomycetota bacterium]